MRGTLFHRGKVQGLRKMRSGLWRELLVAVKFHPGGRGRAGVPASPLASRESRYGGPLESPTCAP